MIDLQVTSKSFPSGGPIGVNTLQFSKAQLCWAALTVGKPDKAAAKAFGSYSRHEALYRWNMVLSALDFTKTPNRTQNSALFNALDPTEKGGINFYLGMIFLKLCAHKMLNIPWLAHYHWMDSYHTISKHVGKSTPDLLGYDSVARQWAVFEAKGRNADYSQALMNKAKIQADRVISVDGNPCTLRVGSQLYRDKSNLLAFAWEDPATKDEPPIELKTTRETWLEYYSVVYGLYLEQRKDRHAFRKSMGFNISIHPTARQFIYALESDRDFSNELGSLMYWSANQLKEPRGKWNGDGVHVLIEERW